MSRSELQAIFARAQDPRRHWITVYEGEEGHIFGNVFRAHGEPITTIPFLKSRSPAWPVIALGDGKKKAPVALIDSTSGHCWATPAFLASVRGVPLGPTPYERVPVHVQDQVAGYAFVVPSLRYDSLQVENNIFYLRPEHGSLGFLARRPKADPEPEVVLGASWMAGFSFVQINYPERVVVLSTTIPYAPSADQLLAELEVRWVKGAIATEGMIGGEPATIILDTAGDFAVALPEAKPDGVRVSVGDIGFPRSPAVALRDAALGLPEYPRIGAQLLSKYKVTFVVRADRVYLERP